MKAPKSVALPWWQRGLTDGKTCARKRRAKYFEVYRALATEAIQPGELLGPFNVVYGRAFKYGYESERERRERENTFLPRPKKRVSLKHR